MALTLEERNPVRTRAEILLEWDKALARLRALPTNGSGKGPLENPERAFWLFICRNLELEARES